MQCRRGADTRRQKPASAVVARSRGFAGCVAEPRTAISIASDLSRSAYLPGKREKKLKPDAEPDIDNPLSILRALKRISILCLGIALFCCSNETAPVLPGFGHVRPRFNPRIVQPSYSSWQIDFADPVYDDFGSVTIGRDWHDVTNARAGFRFRLLPWHRVRRTGIVKFLSALLPAN